MADFNEIASWAEGQDRFAYDAIVQTIEIAK